MARVRICGIGSEPRATLRAPRLGQAVEVVAACFAEAGPIGSAPSSENLGYDPVTRQTPDQGHTDETQHQEKRFQRTGEIGRHSVEFHTSKGRPHSGQRGFGSRRISYPQPRHRRSLLHLRRIRSRFNPRTDTGRAKRHRKKVKTRNERISANNQRMSSSLSIRLK